MDLIDFINALDSFLENKLNLTSFSGKMEALKQDISDKLDKKELPMNEVTLSLLNALQNINMSLNDTLIDSEGLNKAKEKLLEINALYEKERKREEIHDIDEEQELLRCVTERVSEEDYLTGNYILIRDSAMGFFDGKIPEREFKKSFEDMIAIIKEVKEDYESAFMNIEKWTLEISVGDKLFREGLKEWLEGLNYLSEFLLNRKREIAHKGLQIIYDGNKKLVINQKLEEYINEIVESAPVVTLMPQMKTDSVNYSAMNQTRPVFPEKQPAIPQERKESSDKTVSPRHQVSGISTPSQISVSPRPPVSGISIPPQTSGLPQSPSSGISTSSQMTGLSRSAVGGISTPTQMAGLPRSPVSAISTPLQTAGLSQSPIESHESFDNTPLSDRQNAPPLPPEEIVEKTKTPVETLESKSGIRRPGGAARRITGAVRSETSSPSPVIEQKITEEPPEPKKEEKTVRKPGGMSRRVGKGAGE